MTESLQARWAHLLSILSSDPNVTARQRGFVNLARPQGLMGSSRLIIEVPNKLTRAVFEEQITAPFRAALHEAFGPTTTALFDVNETMTPIESAGQDVNESEQAAPVEHATVAAHQVPAEPSDYPGGVPYAEPTHREAPAGSRAFEYYTEPHPGPDSEAHVPADERVTRPSLQTLEAERTAFHTAHHEAPVEAPAAPVAPPHEDPENAPTWDSSARLNPNYTFDTFVIGQSNRFAHASAFAVAEQPGIVYNPLFIYGGSGLGKTHLLHAIDHYTKYLYPNLRVRYVNSEEFTNDFINSIRDDEGSSFKQIYRNVDVLLIDDIQFLAGKEATMEEFFHTFNALYNHQKQIVITSDLPPKQLTGFAERMRSRFGSGLNVDVQPPELETRIAILRKKAQSEILPVRDDVMEYIASHVTANIRELEGALIRASAAASMKKPPEPITLAEAETYLKDLLSDTGGAEITSALVLSTVAKYFDVSIEDMQSKSRTRTLTNARQVAMYLLRELTEMSLPRIGNDLGGRDHTTVMHAVRKVSAQMAERQTIFNQVTELTNLIRQEQRAAG
ncbi:MAG: chromosomal replication initiator protein DnaA [Rothia mucilaginosa]|uniref:chromosomal replication initiator protein DnaA n=1 Tax=Rothia mucilaginosa TaxID=43675 RepID=UPI001DC4AEF5|nr:chromosomal replication initiator protein DnaA [Rothia mucilaginosa]MBS6433244.1 chromosomal replication initiator protein DnaA [Rothia mucilaginosa]